MSLQKTRGEKLNLEKYPEYENWILGVADSTAKHYKSALREYCNFTGMNPRELIDQAEEDRNKPRRERSETERMLREFKRYLKERKGSPTTVKHKFAIVKSFYSDNNFPQKEKIPKANPQNKEIKLRKRHVRKLVNHAPTLRDKAIILMGFQAGMDVSTVCSLNYGDVAEGLERDEKPLLIETERPKKKVQYRTFIASDGIEALKAYLRHREKKFGKPKWDDPLFVKEERKVKKRNEEGEPIEYYEPERIETDNIHKMMREIAVESGLVSEDRMEKAPMNPARFHGLRKGFSTILENEGVNQNVIEGMMGHEVPYNGAYSQHTDEELRAIYRRASSELSISEIPEYAKDQEERIKYNEEMIKALLHDKRELEEKIGILKESTRETLSQLAYTMGKMMAERGDITETEAFSDFFELLQEKFTNINDPHHNPP